MKSALLKAPRIVVRAALAVLAGCGVAMSAWAQPITKIAPFGGPNPQYAPGTRFQPDSNHTLASDVGRRSHTYMRLMVPPANAKPPKAQSPYAAAPNASDPPYYGYFFETPQSLQCIYGLTTGVTGCNPNAGTLTTLNTGARAIAIVDAYDYPAALSDLTAFSSQFGLPAPTSSNFQVVYATGTRPADGSGSGWDIEAALDIEWAHAMTPKAKVYLVEAASDYDTDLFNAVQVAAGLVAQAGGGEVSMSWGESEYNGETAYDSAMTTNSVVYFAAAGDSSGTSYPCVSPNVVCVGGISNYRNPLTGTLLRQQVWADTGGGLALYESRPSYQKSLSSKVGPYRGVPDVAAIADLNTGVWVYNTTYSPGYAWWVVGGTSVATPVMAGIVNSAGTFNTSSSAELTLIYSKNGLGWTAITEGWCGFYDGFVAAAGWGFCTGWGAPHGLTYK
jgi:kumamolisin